jgi:hypothetical protein
MSRSATTFWLAAVCTASAMPARAQIEFEREPINYGSAPTSDRVTRLQQELDGGGVTLTYDEEHGYLKSLLAALDVPVSSQALVFSKTSFQLRRISPSRPRAIYHNDDTYVGFCQGGEVLELASVDPEQGTVFYTLPQERVERPRFIADRGECLTCHASSRTQGIPGVLVRSVFSDERGQPMIGSGTFSTDHRSPLAERWGGWYVTGTHGRMRHMGNVQVRDRTRPEQLDRESGANVIDLSAIIDTRPYLASTSDIVSLMLLEHQVQMQNYLTLAGYETRHALFYDQVMNEALDRPADYQSESTQRRVAAVGDKVLKYLLFAEEFPLTSPVSGSDDFRRDVETRGPRDSRGRSLRDLDLERRLLKYPCSYLIYSETFDRLPAPVHTYVCGRLHRILTGADDDAAFARLTSEDRLAILEILSETKPGLWPSLSDAGPPQ